VLADFNAFPLGTPVMQPGPDEGGDAEDVCAKLSEFVALSPVNDNFVDAALAEIDKELIPEDVGYSSNYVPTTRYPLEWACRRSVAPPGRPLEWYWGPMVRA